MKHKAKSFIAVLLALCLMMSLGVGALAVDESDGFDTPGGAAIGPDPNIPSGGVNIPGGGGKEDDSIPPEPRVGEEYNINIAEGIVGGTVKVVAVVDGSDYNTTNPTTAKADNLVIVSVIADPSYELTELKVTKGDNSEVNVTPVYNNQYNFTMPASNVMISAVFQEKAETPKTHTITVTSTPAKGGTVEFVGKTLEGGKTTATVGERVTFTVKPNEGYEVFGVTPSKALEGAVNVDLSKEPTEYYFEMPDADVTIAAIFTPDEGGETTGEHSITANVTPAEGGTVELSQTTADEGTKVTFTVKPNPGYEMDGGPRISGLSGTIDTNADGSYTFTMEDEDVTITVAFKQVAYAINVTQPANGKVSTEPEAMAAAGTTVTLSAVPDTGYELVGYSVKDASGKPVTVTGNTFEMPSGNVTVSATFKKVETEPETHKITVSAPNADIYIVGGADRVEGAVVSFTVKPDSGYKVMGVWAGTEKLTAVNGVYSFTMPDNTVAIVVECRPLDWPDWSHWHKIDTWSNSVDGGISVGNDADMALAGSEVTFRVWHNYKYDYYDYDVYVLNDRTGNRVSLDYSAYDDEYSFTMPDDDVTIYVYFDYVGTYSITKDVEGDGSIYVRSSADRGDTVWIEASPNAGQSLTSLRVFYGEPWAYGDKGYYGYWDEAEVKYSTYWDAYYFTMPADDVVVYARFTDGATVDVITGDHGDAKVSSRYAEKGDWVYITAYPDEGYEVDSVTVTDSLGRSVKVTELSYDYFLFTMPGTSVDVKVTFRAKDYDVFYDVSRGDWYYKAVRFVHEKGIMEGTGTHYFSPEADLSRGMLATILYRLEGSPSVSGYSGFSDVADTAYYAKAVAWAKANGIVNGVTATAYEPDTAVTREELAAILCRYAAFKGKDTAISYDYLAGFSDANTSHVYARPALNWAVAYDIINGQGNGVLAPRATATRAEVAQVLMNYLEVFD